MKELPQIGWIVFDRLVMSVGADELIFEHFTPKELTGGNKESELVEDHRL